ncbi:MAG: protein arginine kinase [Ruminococcaceae bacterium]|nr:protein arginine kinase [Oscillospiraceae bacterium]
MSNWYKTQDQNSSVAVSSRIRLARNLKGLPFPARMTTAQRIELNQRVKEAILGSNTPFAKTLKYIDMHDVPETQKFAMVERHIISPEFANKTEPTAIILSSDESISIMIGEEDHIRIQVILAGLNLAKAYDIAEQIDTLLHDSLHFAFDSKLGFLTECPTNLGTGLRASVMLHLPALEWGGEIETLGTSISKIGFTVRGMYGEGSKSMASLYQVSNQITLGLGEKNALDNLLIITNQLIEKEIESRNSLNKLELEDQCFRALGILQNARILSSSEMMNLISCVKLGKSMGILDIKASPIEILVEAQPFMLCGKYGVLEPRERDIYRANMVRETLK